MTEAASQPEPRSARPLPIRFSLGTLLLMVTVVCLAIALGLTHRRLARIERDFAEAQRELGALQPLSAEEVARQFEEATTLGPISTTVKDVRYSPTEDAYKVEFSWVDAASGQTWATEVKLTADGYGTYFGRIQSESFVKPLGRQGRLHGRRKNSFAAQEIMAAGESINGVTHG